MKSFIEEKPEKLEQNNKNNDNEAYKYDKKQLYQEKLKLEEELDTLKVNFEKQNTIINELNMELKYKLDELKLENELIIEEKTKVNEIITNELNEKCELIQNLNAKVDKLMKTNSSLLGDRIKLSEMCSNLTEENNRLYKKWILIKKSENKQKILIERMKKVNYEMNDKKNIKRKIKKARLKNNKKIDTDTDYDILDIEREDVTIDKTDYFDKSDSDEDRSIENNSTLIFWTIKNNFNSIIFYF